MQISCEIYRLQFARNSGKEVGAGAGAGAAFAEVSGDEFEAIYGPKYLPLKVASREQQNDEESATVLLKVF